MRHVGTTASHCIYTPHLRLRLFYGSKNINYVSNHRYTFLILATPIFISTFHHTTYNRNPNHHSTPNERILYMMEQLLL